LLLSKPATNYFPSLLMPPASRYAPGPGTCSPVSFLKRTELAGFITVAPELLAFKKKVLFKLRSHISALIIDGWKVLVGLFLVILIILRLDLGS